MAQLSDPAAYDTDPEKAWRRLKPRKFAPRYLAAFKAAAAFRERAAQARDMPRGRILKGRGDGRDRLPAAALGRLP